MEPYSINMVLHICNYCNKIFSRKGNLNKHLHIIHDIDNRKLNIKNITNVEKKIDINQGVSAKISAESAKSRKTPNENDVIKRLTCSHCDFHFKRPDYFKKHLSRCKEKQKFDQEDKNKDILIKEQTKIIANLSKLGSKQSDSIDRMTSTYQEICKNMTNAPALELDQKKIKTIMYGKHEDESEMIKQILYQFKNGNFVEYVGYGIVSVFVTKKPCDQSIWCTDTTRIKYIIRNAMKDKNIWEHDPNGHELKTKVIIPILERISDIMNKLILSNTPVGIDWDEFYGKRMEAYELNKKLIDDKTFIEKINKYIAPYFKTRR